MPARPERLGLLPSLLLEFVLPRAEFLSHPGWILCPQIIADTLAGMVEPTDCRRSPCRLSGLKDFKDNVERAESLR